VALEQANSLVERPGPSPIGGTLRKSGDSGGVVGNRRMAGIGGSASGVAEAILSWKETTSLPPPFSPAPPSPRNSNFCKTRFKGCLVFPLRYFYPTVANGGPWGAAAIGARGGAGRGAEGPRGARGCGVGAVPVASARVAGQRGSSLRVPWRGRSMAPWGSWISWWAPSLSRTSQNTGVPVSQLREPGHSTPASQTPMVSTQRGRHWGS